MILVGVSALCWAIWRCWNDVVFNKTKYTSFMQALFRGTYWMRFWSQLQCDDDTKEMFRKASSMLEVIVLEQVNHGWKHNNRLTPFLSLRCLLSPFVFNNTSWKLVKLVIWWPYTFRTGQILIHYLKKHFEWYTDLRVTLGASTMMGSLLVVILDCGALTRRVLMIARSSTLVFLSNT
jgi:hypothetical protein